MRNLLVMTPTQEINQTEPFPIEEIREVLKGLRPYDVAHLATEVMGQLHEYTRNGTLDKEYGHFFVNMHWELENILDSGVLGYFNGDPPYRPEDDCAEDDSAG